MLLLSAPESLVTLVKPWADFYGHSKAAVTVVTFLHVGGLLLAGGFAIAEDRSNLRALRMPFERRMAQLEELAMIHRWVLGGLTVVFLSGLLMLAADLETFLGSAIYWTKMALVAALLGNGVLLTRVERAVANVGRDAPESALDRQWRALRRTSIASIALWFAITLAGLALVNFS